MSITDRVLQSVNLQPHVACTDAKHGVDELKLFAKEDPSTMAVGVGVADALYAAIVLGPMGLILGAASVGVGYKIMQLPDDQINGVVQSKGWSRAANWASCPEGMPEMV